MTATRCSCVTSCRSRPRICSGTMHGTRAVRWTMSCRGPRSRCRTMTRGGMMQNSRTGNWPSSCHRPRRRSRAVEMMMVTMRRTYPRAMPGRITRRTGYPVNMARVMPVTAVPGSRTPGRHQTRCRQRSKGEYCCSRCRVAIHGATVVIAENRESVHIVTGIRPRYRCVPPGPAHADGCIRVQRIAIRSTGA